MCPLRRTSSGQRLSPFRTWVGQDNYGFACLSGLQPAVWLVCHFYFPGVFNFIFVLSIGAPLPSRKTMWVSLTVHKAFTCDLMNWCLFGPDIILTFVLDWASDVHLCLLLIRIIGPSSALTETKQLSVRTSSTVMITTAASNSKH